MTTKTTKTNKLYFSIDGLTIENWNTLKNEKRIRFDIAAQRPLVASWKKPDMMNPLIDSIMTGYSINTFQVRVVRIDDNDNEEILDNITVEELMTDKTLILDCIDSKQRSHAIFRIYDDEYKPNFEVGHDFECLNTDYSEWSKEEKNQFKNFILEVTAHIVDDEGLPVLFKRFNSGKSLTTLQKMRGQYVSHLESLAPAINHIVFSHPEFKLEGKSESIIMKVYAAMKQNYNHVSTHLVKWFIANPPTEEDVKNIVSALDNLESIIVKNPDNIASLKRFMKVSHLSTTLPVLQTVEEKTGENLINFFSQIAKTRTQVRIDYSAVCVGGTNSVESVEGRYKIIHKALTTGNGCKPLPKPEKVEKAKTEKKPAIDDKLLDGFVNASDKVDYLTKFRSQLLDNKGESMPVVKSYIDDILMPKNTRDAMIKACKMVKNKFYVNQPTTEKAN